MPRARVKDHVHKYERIKMWRRGDEIYACRLPDCFHYIPAPMAVGKLSKCWGCENAVEFTTRMVMHDRTKKPFCDSCKELRAASRRALKELPREEDIA